jgi:hypothetical protein
MKILLTLLFGIICNYTFAQADATLSKTIKGPAAMVAGSYGGKLSAEKIKQAKQLEIEGGWEITGYVIYLTGTGFPEPMYKQVMGSGQFDKDVLELISKSGPGTTIAFDEISAKNSKSGSKVRITPTFFNLY